MDPVPDGWRRMKLKYVADLKSGDAITSDDIAPEGAYAVFGGNGLRGYTNAYTHEGVHVLIGRQGALCGNVNYATGRFWASEHAVVVTIRGKHHPRWLGELLRSMNLNQYSQAAAQPGLAVEFISNLHVMVPPLHVQRAIADYLDTETARINALIVAKENLLAILAEKRRAVITQAVTRGLNPDVPMRDSGVPWIGEIPAHWQAMRLKFLIDGIEQGWSPQCDNYPAELDEWGVLKTGCVNGDMFDESENKRLPNDLDPRPDLEVMEGDFLMSRANTTALVGSAAFVREVRPRLLLCDKLYRLRVRDSQLDAEFLELFFNTPVGRLAFERDASGASGSMQNISQDAVRNVLVAVPSVAEQRRIVVATRALVLRMDQVRDSATHTIQLLRERREALITAAVTGQLDVGA